MIDGYQQLSRESRGWKAFSEFWADIQQQMQRQLQYSLEKQLVLLQQDYPACGYHQRADRLPAAGRPAGLPQRLLSPQAGGNASRSFAGFANPATC